MAKRKTTAVSKSAAIREYISANPSAGPTAIYDALTKQGIKVSKGLVSVVKYSKPKPGKQSSQPKRKAVSDSGGGMSAAELIATKQVVDSLGGIAQTKEIVDLLKQL